MKREKISVTTNRESESLGILALVFPMTKYNRAAVRALLAALEAFELNAGKGLSIHLPTVEEVLDPCWWNGEYGKIKSMGVPVFCLSFASASRNLFEKIINSIEERDSRALIAAGGAHPTAFSPDLFVMGAHLVFHGEGEITFTDFLSQRLKAGRDASERANIELRDQALLLKQRILSSREEARKMMLEPLKSQGMNLRMGLQGLKSLDQVPCLPQINPLIGPLEISRGCPYRCAYCETPSRLGATVRHRSPEQIFRCVRDFRLWSLRFISPNAFAYPWMEELLRGLAGMKWVKDIYWGSFPSEVRPDWVSLEKLKLVRELCRNSNMVIGAQSGGDGLLERIGRGHGREDVERAAALCREADLNPLIDIILGIPGETEEDDRQTAEMCEVLLLKYGARFTMHSFMPLPGAEYRFMEAGAMGPFTLDFINRYVGRGVIQGSWKRQKSLGQELRELYLRYGIIDK